MVATLARTALETFISISIVKDWFTYGKWSVHWFLPFNVNKQCTKRRSMTRSCWSACKVGPWRTPDETDYWVYYAARIENAAITCNHRMKEKYNMICIPWYVYKILLVTWLIISAGRNIVVLKPLDWWLKVIWIQLLLVLLWFVSY